MLRYLVIPLLCLLSGVVQTLSMGMPRNGSCPELEVQQNFSLNDYQGTWFKQAGFNTEIVESDMICAFARYLLVSNDPPYLQFQHTGMDFSNKKIVINGTMGFSNPLKKEARLTMKLQFHTESMTEPYWVLDTDYKTYAVVYSCAKFLEYHYPMVWLLSRQVVLTSSNETNHFYNITEPTLTRLNISISELHLSDPEKCQPLKEMFYLF